MSEPHGVVQLREEISAAIAGAIDAADGQELLTEEIECTICTRPALRDPVKTPCEHIFHRECLEQALGVRRECPNCRDEIPGDAVFPAPERTVRSMIARLLVCCPQRCGARPMRFDSVAAHVGDGGDCPETPIRCANQGCGVVTARRGAGQHSAVCPHRNEPCPQCNAQIPHSDLQNHIANQCENRRVPCQHCAEQIVLSKQRQHLREECTAPVPMKHYVQLQEQQQQQEQRLAALEQLLAEQLSAQRQAAAIREEAAARDRIAGEWDAERGALQADLRRALARLAPRTLCTAVQPAAAGNTSHGLFFDLQCKGRPVAVSALWIAHYKYLAPARHDWSVWTRTAAGTYRDQLGRGGWGKLCDGIYAGEPKQLHRCPFGRAVTVAAGSTQAFYVHCSSGGYVTITHTGGGYAPSADEAVALRPGTYSASPTAFDGIANWHWHGRYDFVGRVEYRVTE
eukprot:TRINITY_DN1734_c0_g1_i8.p1 TRINITY_DN1734_c0_g1~~TRINITY_DN1734_c0_g1_i8.p1  ORF type:complete len:456 (+),score=114.07 TRINITY_DN1734_c0_g1_i8:91-1458(+)